ncbi:hypothetical protein ACFP9Y_10740, partial [Nonomuraea cavernae]
MAGGPVDVNTSTSGGLPSAGEGGTSSTDIRPVWETESFPDWVNYVLIPLLASGQSWPKASESGLWAMAKPHERTMNAMVTAFDPTAQSVKLVLSGWQAPATPGYLRQVTQLFGENTGAGALAKQSDGYYRQIDAFARETQYSKISINVAFYIALIAAFIALLAAFFSAGSTAWLVGPYAAAARRAVARILELLAINAGRGFVASSVGRVTALAGLSRLVASPIARERVEEVGEEVYIDYKSQEEQRKMGTREGTDWRKMAAAAVGALFGADVGMRLANRTSRLADSIPGISQLNRMAGDSPGFSNALLRFPGRAMSTGLNNTIASPVGSLAANALVYGQVAMPGTDAFVGGFMGGVGRTGTISPFNPDVALALSNPSAALAQATDAANRTDVARAVDQAMANRPAPATGPTPSTPSPAGVTPVGVTPAGLPVPSASPTPAPAAPQAPGSVPRQTGPQLQPGQQPDAAATQAAPTARTPAQPATPSVQSGPQPAPDPATQPDPAKPAPSARPAQTAQPDQTARQDQQVWPPRGTENAPLVQPTENPRPVQLTENLQPGQDGQTTANPHTTESPQTAPSIPPDQATAQPSPWAPPDPGMAPQAPVNAAPDPAAQPTTSAGSTTTAGGTTAPTAPNTLSAVMAQAAVTEAQRLAFPHAIPLQDGGVFLTDARGRSVSLSPEALRRTEERLTSRAANGATAKQLVAEAAAALGAEIAIAGGRPATEGALEGLDQLADADPGTAPDAADHSRAWNDDVEHAEQVASRLSARALGPDAAVRAGFYDIAAQEIMDRLAALGTQQATSPSPAPETGGPRTVPAQQIENSLFQPQRRRPAHHGAVTDTEIRAAITTDLDLTDFGGEVLSLTWADPSSTTMLVETRTHGTLHYRIRIGGVSGDNVAESEIRTGSVTDPIVIKIAPRASNESLYRAVVHEISHGGQTRAAAATRSEQGTVRRWLSRTRPVEGVDECVAPRLNEFRFLTRKWRAAGSMDEKQRWAHEIDQLLADLRDRGQSPPLPPWSSGSAAAPPPVTTPHADLVAYVRRTVDSLTETIAGLEARYNAKEASQAAAKAAAKVAAEQAHTADGQKDHGAPERARKARVNEANERIMLERHRRIAEAYDTAGEYADYARKAYELLLAELERGASAAQAAPLAVQAKSWLDDFQLALTAALPSLAALPSFVPAGRLPHLNRLTETVNDLLQERGIDEIFTPAELGRRLSTEFSRVLSADGALIRVGRDVPGEILIKLSVTDLVEVLDPGKIASEIMQGVLPQGGQTIGATANANRGANAGLRLDPLIAALPDSQLKKFLEHLEMSATYNTGFTSSVTGNATDFALDGAVEDNRGESVQYDGRARWSVQARTSSRDGWSPEAVVDHGYHDDVGSLRAYVSHAYMDSPPMNPLRLPADQRRQEFPEHVVLGLTGMLKLAEDTMKALGEKNFPPGSVARQQVLTAFVDDFYSRMEHAVNDPQGVPRIIHVNGRPFAQLSFRAVPRVDTAEPVGAPSRSHWQERLRVGVTSATGNQSFSRSGGVGGSLGLRVVPELDAVRGDDEYTVASGPNFRGSAGASAADGLSVNGVTYHPSVQRYTGYTQGVALEFDYEVTAHLIDADKQLGPIRGEGGGLFRFAESDAYWYGLPVAQKAVEVREDGTVVHRDDPDPKPPKGRKGELPSFYGNEPGKLRGAGPALVRGIDDADRLRKETEDKLRAMGVLAPLDPETGEPIYSSDLLERWSQMVNEREIADQLVKHRLQSGYDQAAQDGIMIDLITLRSGRAPRHLTLRVTLNQHFTDEHGRPRSKFGGITTAYADVNLDIGSDTNVWSHARSENVSGGLGYGANHQVPKGQEGVSPNAGVGGGRDYSRTLSHTIGLTINGVQLNEATVPLAIFDIPHTARVELLHANGDVEQLASVDGSARLLISSDSLPEDGTERPLPPPSAPTPTPDEIMRYATIQHMDVPNLLDVARELLPRAARPDSPAFHHLAEFLNVRSLIAHPEMLRTPYGTELVIRPQGAAPTKASISVQVRVGKMVFLGANNNVKGDINLTLYSMGVTAGRSSGGKVEGSAGANLQDADGSGEGGKVGAGHSGGESRSQYDLSIYGMERLGIGLGKQYEFLTDIELDLTGVEGDGTQVTRTVDGTMLYTVPERVALRMYAKGSLDLPLYQVADVVERFLDRTLRLDRSVAVPLVKRYLSELSQSTDWIPLAARHTPAVLIGGLKTVVNAGSTLTKVDDFLTRATELIAIPREVEIPRWLMKSIGITLIEDIRLAREGTDIELLNAVRDAIEAVAPDVLQDRVIADSLRKIFGGTRWWGPIDNIFSADGLPPLRYYTPYDELGRRDKVVVTVRAEFTGRAELTDRAELDTSAELLETTDEVGNIIQAYTYKEQGRSETRWASNSVHAGIDVSGEGHGHSPGGNTDRSLSSSGSFSEQDTGLQGYAVFNGMDLVQQRMKLVIEVERTRQQARAVGLTPLEEPAGKVTVELTGHMDRWIQTGLTRPVGTQPAEPGRTFDPRQVPTIHSFMANSVKTDLYQRISEALRNPRLFGEAVEVLDVELRNQLSEMATTALFERMTGERGHPIRLPVIGLRNREVDVWVKAVQSNLQVLARGLQGVEIRQVYRFQRLTGSSSSGGMAFPVGGSFGLSDPSGLNGGVSVGEQSSVSRANAGGNRREMSRFERDNAVIVQLTTDYDLTFTRQALTPEGTKYEAMPIHLPRAATGEVVAIMSETDYEALVAAMEAGAPLGPEWELIPEPAVSWGPQTSTAPPEQADPARPWGSLMDARIKASRSGTDISIDVTGPDGRTYTYHISPDGSLRSEDANRAFAEAFATLSPALVELADRAGLDLRDLFDNPRTQATFADRIRTELAARGVDLATLEAPTVWPSRPVLVGETASGGRSMGSTGGVGAPEVAGSAFIADGRAPHLPDATLDELKEATARDLRISDFGGKLLGLSWSGSTLTVETQAWGTLTFQVEVGEVPPGRVAMTDPKTGRMVVSARTANDQLARAVLHEISHAGQAMAARAQPSVVRRLISRAKSIVGHDHCVSAHFDEFRHLARRWAAAKAAHDLDPTPEREDEARKWRHELQALDARLRTLGHTPPSFPWTTGRSATPGFHTGAVAALPTTAAGLGTLADLSGVGAIAPTGSPRTATTPAGQPSTFTVTSPAGQLTLEVSEADLPPGTVEVRASSPGALSVAVSPSDGGSVRMRLAELIAQAVADQMGMEAGHALRPGPLSSVPDLRRGDAATLVRVRALIEARAAASPFERGAIEDRLRAELRDAGLTPGTEGATARQVSAARAGLLPAAHLDLINELSGRTVHPTATAIVAAITRTAALLGATTSRYGSTLVDVTLPDGTSIPVEVRADSTSTGQSLELTTDQGVHTLTVDLGWPVPALERSVAGSMVSAILTASGVPEDQPVPVPSAPGGTLTRREVYLAIELQELLNQVRTATPQQRPGRFALLVHMAELRGLGKRSPDRDANRALLPYPIGAELTEMLDHSIEGESPRAFWERMRKIANGTGWYPPEEYEERRPVPEQSDDNQERGTWDQEGREREDRERESRKSAEPTPTSAAPHATYTAPPNPGAVYTAPPNPSAVYPAPPDPGTGDTETTPASPSPTPTTPASPSPTPTNPAPTPSQPTPSTPAPSNPAPTPTPTPTPT